MIGNGRRPPARAALFGGNRRVVRGAGLAHLDGFDTAAVDLGDGHVVPVVGVQHIALGMSSSPVMAQEYSAADEIPITVFFDEGATREQIDRVEEIGRASCRERVLRLV